MTAFRAARALLLLLIGCTAALAQTSNDARYRLLEGAAITDPAAPMPIAINGTFDLRFDATTPQFDRYRVADFRAAGATKTLRGAGTYMLQPAVLGLQRMVLDLTTETGVPLHLDSGWVPTEAPFPSVGITLTPLNLPPDLVALYVRAVPTHPAWFSTVFGLHAGNLGDQAITPGDLLTSGGIVIASNQHLTHRLGVMPLAADLGLDAVMPAPRMTAERREFYFSTELDAFSETLGPLDDGDLLDSRGAVTLHHAELLAPFGAMATAPVGLDALSAGPPGNYLFSVETPFFSPALGRMIGHGDLLSDLGAVVRTNAQLLARFHPLLPIPDLGLDAVWAQPSGEVWFSVVESFFDSQFGMILNGDILSDSGWVIARNRQLVARLGPLEDLLNFGLDALHIVPLPRGDMNGDGAVNNFDIDPFVLALVNRDLYYESFPEISPDITGDINGDGVLNNFDIDPFVACILNPPPPGDPCP